ncbi:TPA: hypothetical protein N0F65_004367 [Lagenidium giganteum]|uniref:Elicitin-like protein n=1 Tax=Lagenidium giganteum TaxID=4803 RepID=A0AAV2ZNK4_9STRA|nr:TPA: hypothetical protein N0F65_004367 [Lagenidium giganteum]
MAKFSAILAASLAFAAVYAHGDGDHAEAAATVDPNAPACDAKVSKSVVDVIGNGTLFSSCAAPNGTWEFKDIFGAAELKPAEFLTWCSSSVCMAPMHHLLDTLPTNCTIEFGGKPRNLSAEIDHLHHDCHKAKDGAKNATGGGNSTAGNSTKPAAGKSADSAPSAAGAAGNKSSPSPTPKSDASVLSGKAAVATLSATVAAAALML